MSARTAPTLAFAKATAAPAPLVFGETSLVAKDRRAWRLAELVTIDPDSDVHAKTAGGGDLVITDPAHALVVQREAGDLYVAWLVPNVAVNDPRPLADLEAPAARIEGVTALATVERAQDRARPTGPAALAVTLDGKPVTTLTAAAFTRLAKIHVEHKHESVPAIDVARAFGPATVVQIDADGAQLAGEAPAPGARAVIFMNKRERFNFAWVDAAGKPLGTKLREVTGVALKTRS